MVNNRVNNNNRIKISWIIILNKSLLYRKQKQINGSYCKIKVELIELLERKAPPSLKIKIKPLKIKLNVYNFSYTLHILFAHFKV